MGPKNTLKENRKGGKKQKATQYPKAPKTFLGVLPLVLLWSDFKGKPKAPYFERHTRIAKRNSGPLPAGHWPPAASASLPQAEKSGCARRGHHSDWISHLQYGTGLSPLCYGLLRSLTRKKTGGRASAVSFCSFSCTSGVPQLVVGDSNPWFLYKVNGKLRIYHTSNPNLQGDADKTIPSMLLQSQDNWIHKGSAYTECLGM